MQTSDVHLLQAPEPTSQTTQTSVQVRFRWNNYDLPIYRKSTRFAILDGSPAFSNG